MDPLWSQLEKNHGYIVKEKLGEGTYGLVYKAECTTSGNEYAIKLIKNPFKSKHEAIQLYREIKIMRKLQEIDHNIFTSQIVDLILPGCSFKKSKSDKTSST